MSGVHAELAQLVQQQSRVVRGSHVQYEEGEVDDEGDEGLRAWDTSARLASTSTPSTRRLPDAHKVKGRRGATRKMSEMSTVRADTAAKTM